MDSKDTRGNEKCRTCLNIINNKMFNVFKKEIITIADFLISCTSIKIQARDDLPKNICEACHKQIMDFQSFRCKAEACDKKLRGITKDIKLESNYGDVYEFDIADAGFEDDSNSNANDESGNKKIDIAVTENNPPYGCGVCFKKFTALDTFRSHIGTHRDNKDIISAPQSDCLTFFNDNSKLNHDEITEIKTYSCGECPQRFRRQATLLSHSICHKKETEITSEEKKLDENKNFVCEVCSTVYRSPQSLSAHMRKHQKGSRVSTCATCGKTFKKLSHLKRHEFSHDINRIHKCTDCSKSFCTKEKLMDHINNHKGIKPFVCPLCSKAFAGKRSLETHVKIHSRPKTYLCPKCGKPFDSNSNLTQHMKRHLADKSFSCSFCPGKFVSKGELQCHVNSHLGIKPYTCNVCGSSFTKSNSLSKHKLLHLGIKPYQCDTCVRKFSNKDHLKRHRRIHTGEKPYKCEYCERAFTQSNDLLKHRRSHLGDKIYKCPQCDVSFRLKTELRQHEAKHYISSQMASGAMVVLPTIKQGNTANSVGVVNYKDADSKLDENNRVVMSK